MEKKIIKSIKDVEKIMSLMTQYKVSNVEIEGFKLVKNLHELPEIKSNAETNASLNEAFRWPDKM